MPQSVGVEAESWTECELNWAGPKSSGYFCICRTVSLFCTRRSHFIDTDTANSGPPKTEKKKITLKSGRVFFGNPQHDIILSYCESEFEPLFQLQQPCSHKKTQKLVAVLLSLYSSKYFLFPFGLCFQLFFFFWAKMLHYFLGHLEEVRSYMAMKMKPSSGESGLLISEWKSKTHNKCMAFEIRGPHGRALADRLCHGAWVVRLRGLLKKASTGRN